jgi:phage shock protein A
MAIITRLSRLLRADLNAMLDRLEAPELVLAQAVRDMEQAQMLEGARLKRLEHEAARLEKFSTELEQRLEQDQAALDDCLSAGQDNLARAVLRRSLEAERTIARLGR